MTGNPTNKQLNAAIAWNKNRANKWLDRDGEYCDAQAARYLRNIRSIRKYMETKGRKK